jgi:hypothetical protein
MDEAGFAAAFEALLQRAWEERGTGGVVAPEQRDFQPAAAPRQ